ncbi:MAG TPA: hypothetical protein PLI79_09315 [Mycobacterium sp.]|nr:MAG: hypothetical protein E6Q57_16455 [Mycobacterium sp.]HMZ14128.1 hypothetical protein [Mycobacterium sp.]HNA49425.1 hypothetical protein [Mycobacterium sp.]HNF03744.1 hypothetical protein [Mycobacterium sp.]HNM12068.1 hypothetical protein [Mycobacterium sp.]
MRRRWKSILAWAALVVFVYGGVTVLVAVLHPQGKQDPRGIPIALFALASALTGIAVLLRRRH